MRSWRACLLLLAALPACLPARRSRSVYYTNHWAVRVLGGPGEADRLASAYGYLNLGQVGSLEDYYHFHHSKTIKRSTFSSRGPHNLLRMDPKVKWIQQQEVKARVKRQVRRNQRFVSFNDPSWPAMWYMHCEDNNSQCRSEMNVLGAWQRGYTGKGVVVTILDDGIERSHPDLVQNYDPQASYDVNGNDEDPTPRYDPSNENKHGTRCAGEVAASANNSICIVGIAYNARIGGIRMLDGDVTDVVEAKAIGAKPEYIHVYSASWGPDDDGRTVDGPGPLAKQAFENGIKKGRRGRGSIFVWASGNGGREGDHCSCDGYTNSIYTVSVSSTTENGNKPWYLEECASTLATTYSSGALYERQIVTTDLKKHCTDGHTGTSVSAPMVAGIIALALEANPLLTWRDVQHLIVKTSRPVHLLAPDWKTNGAGRRVSHLYGFGLVDAESLVVEAKRWKTVPAQHICVGTSNKKPWFFPANKTIRTMTLTSACVDNPEHHVVYLEHVVVRISIVHPRRGDLQIYLTSPSGTKSQLLARRQHDDSNEGFKHWDFMTVHCWGERAAGEWTLEIQDKPYHVRNPDVQGKLKEWSLILYGTSEHPSSNISTQHFRPTMLDPPSLEMEPSKVAFFQNQMEIPEEEDEYTGLCHRECGDQGCDGPNADQCLNCFHYSLGSVKTGRKCVNSCPPGYFGDGLQRKCRRCHRGCEACLGRSQNLCTACRRGYYHHQETNTCVMLCPAGFYSEDGQRRCQKCHQNCKKCFGEMDKCSVCKDGFSLVDNNCVSVCQQGLYLKKELLQCEGCEPDCRTCTGPSQEECIQCGKTAYEWRCVSTCGEGYYHDERLGLPFRVCGRCEDNCLSCDSSGRNCSRCKEGFYLMSGSCIARDRCHNGDETFCEMVKSNKLCERKPFIQFCCRTCLLAG
ncbi:proprotein convertase subtilisin/kexin type 6 [Erythrolamprus reginae]|uniref:proprotein convertase subtilisin/kexin type 6 n=1 Tax=Erythrolamprus reginae TaxID=121349 RepID=UPI00396C6DD2